MSAITRLWTGGFSLRISLVCLVVISLSLLFWYGQVIRSDGYFPSHNNGLKGYIRITPGRMNQFLDMHCSQCALVSSSGRMQGAGIGEEIDRVGCVIRMNNAPTKGYEKDVGNQTSLRVLSHTSVHWLVRNQNDYFQQLADTVYVIWGPEKKMRQDGNGSTFNTILKIARKYPEARIYAFTQERVQYCDDVFQNETGKNRLKSGAYLSTGFFTMILAMDMCDSIHVYGMINDDYCNHANHSAVSYHYYQRSKVGECGTYRFHENVRHGGHRFITEKVIYARWAKQHKIQFKHPSWSP